MIFGDVKIDAVIKESRDILVTKKVIKILIGVFTNICLKIM